MSKGSCVVYMNINTMKVFIISRGIPSQSNPQLGNFELDQARALVKRGHTVVVLSVDRRWCKFRLKRKIGLTYAHIDGVDLYNLYIPSPFPIGKLPIRLYLFVTTVLFGIVFRTAVRNCGKPDVLHAHYTRNIANAVGISKKYHIPLVGTEHWSKLLTEPTSKEVRQYGDFAYKRIDQLLVVSSALSNAVRSHFGVNGMVVPNIVDVSTFRYRALPKREHPFTFVAVGSLYQVKAFDLLISAFKQANFADSVKLVIVGGGEEYPKLRKQIDELELNEQVELSGRKTRAEIADILADSHVFVLSSHSETFGVVCIEAMAMGLPVIATDCGGTKEIIDPFNGVLVPVNDVGKLSDVMIEMYHNYKNYDAQSISDNCINKYSPEVIAKQLEGVYLDVVRKRQ